MTNQTAGHERALPLWVAECRHQWQQELERIMHFWSTQMLDEKHGGFLGKRRHDGTADAEAPKGVVLNARILWTFSSAARRQKNELWEQMARRAYETLTNHFFDEVHGGVYWSVAHTGAPMQMHKQTYAQAFAIYGLAAYFQLSGNTQALEAAIGLFHLLEKYAADRQYGGYVEALDVQWQPLADVRLSNKDANQPKTMNTHLHVLEAYTALLVVWPNEQLAGAVRQLLQVYTRHILLSESHTQGLFFTMDWQRTDQLVSFGHDIEAAWLLYEAAEVLGDAGWIQTMAQWCGWLVDAACKGIDADGGMWHEYDTLNAQWHKEKHWWPQAEAMVGLVQAWQLSGRISYLEQAHQSWRFIQQYLLQPDRGEWKWGVDENGRDMEQEDLAGFWKCPYHNSRALMEVLKRLGPQA